LGRGSLGEAIAMVSYSGRSGFDVGTVSRTSEFLTRLVAQQHVVVDLFDQKTPR
jgi:hypothetical protein